MPDPDDSPPPDAPAEPVVDDPAADEPATEPPDVGLVERGRGLLAGIGDRLGDGWRAIRRDRPSVRVDDDPDAEVVDDGPSADEPDLASLDEHGAGDTRAVLDRPDLERDAGVALWSLFGRIDGGPPLPLAAEHRVGLGPLLRGLLDAEDPPALQEWAVDRVLSLVGDRYTLSVGPDGITVRGLLRRRHTSWDDIDGIGVVNRFDALKGGAVARLIDQAVRFPVPGLRWLLERVLGAITDRLARLVLGADEVDAWREASGWVITDIERRGFDIELDGPLLIVSLLAKGTTAAILTEAGQRGIAIDGTD